MKYLNSFFLMILLSSCVLAGNWPYFQGFYNQRGLIGYPTGHFLSANNSFLQLPCGNTFQPLTYTTLADKTYLLCWSGGYLEAYNGNGDVIAQIYTGSPIAQPQTLSNGTDTLIYVPVINSASANQYKPNLRAFRITENDSLIPVWNTTAPSLSGEVCNVAYQGSGASCYSGFCSYWCGVYNMLFNLKNRTGASSGPYGSYPALSSIPVIDSFSSGLKTAYRTQGGYAVVVFDTFASGQINYASVVVFQVFNNVSNPTFYNVRGTGDAQLFLNYRKTFTLNDCLASYNTDGSLNWESCLTGTASASYGQPVIVLNGNSGKCKSDGFTPFCTMNCAAYGTFSSCVSQKNIFGQNCCTWENNRPYVCAVSANKANLQRYNYQCVNYLGQRVSNKTFYSGGADVSRYNNLAGFSANILTGQTSETETSQFVFNKFIIGGSAINETKKNLSSLNWPINSSLIFASLTNDGEGQIIASWPGKTTIFYSNYYTPIPQITSTGFFLNFQNPVCVNSSYIISAKECGFTPCNYVETNPFIKERLVSDCGLSGSLIYGDYSLSQPSLSCFYNQTGTFSNVKIYLQNEINPSDFSVYKSLSQIQVIAGTPGVTCNLLAGLPSNQTVPTQILDNSTLKQELNRVGGYLGVGLTIVWLLIMVATAVMIWLYADHTKGSGQALGVIAFIEVLELVIGVYLGAIGVGLIIILVVLAGISLAFAFRKQISGV